jgi:hypothetical protein
MTNLQVVKKFIKENSLDFSGSGSDLNGACVALAGFICFVLNINDKEFSDGTVLIEKLKLPTDAENELHRVYDFAYFNNYEHFWETEEAKEQYVF